MQKCKYIIFIFLIAFNSNVHAYTQEYKPEDPLYELNRGIFYFNHALFTLYVKPATKVYNYFPEPVKESANNFIQNIRSVPYTINSILQGKMDLGLRNAARFVLNTTAGIFGLFDVAEQLGLAEAKETFGGTLYQWGWKESSYFVVPLIGPSTIRDTIGMGADYFLAPSAYFPAEYWNPYYLLMLVNTNYRAKEVHDLVSIAGVNDYDFIRSSFLQHRYYELTGEVMGGNDSDAELSGPPD